MPKATQNPLTRTGITRRRNAAKRRRLRLPTPLGRLDARGASSARNINRRLLWLAIEWGLERAPKVGQAPSRELCEYCRKHGINFDWLLDGNLKGLQAMMDARRGRMAAAKLDSLGAKLARLSEASGRF
ncbi:hypothetical protein [Bradyrhizobium yuanmingense]|uniref:hypothetical protein n=1 Tax=Bradyrhizobium yuanmingense TaxID=108015 RepID=UPI0012FD9948|nr:hypothetical protein [Bradyrhizobium yuanmingense]